MKINGTPFTSLWYDPGTDRVLYIDQTRLPWELVIREMKTFEDSIRAIRNMEVRGAPLIGVAAAFALYIGMKEHPEKYEQLCQRLLATRPTAANLKNAISWMSDEGNHPSPAERGEGKGVRCVLARALAFREAEIDRCRTIGEHGLPLIKKISEQKNGEAVNILTHCNAGWLATVDYGTALAPIYLAHDQGIKVHVWVDETRPRNQGSRLTAYELSQHGVPCTVIVDNAGGHLMQQGQVDLCIVGADRITRNGDFANKIGTYLKALAAFDNHIPFYVAAPASTFDPDMETGEEIPIEERSGEEIRAYGHTGIRAYGEMTNPGLQSGDVPYGVPVRNPAFDVTPARLVTGYITEAGITPSICHSSLITHH
ncbi:MAG: S-methyl-5-thioribose-1-phosphate isomerase [Bacteroidota bacterium]